MKDEASLRGSGVDALALGREVDALLARFPNAAVNPEERMRLRAALYQPLLALGRDERARIVERIIAILLDGGDRADG